MKSWRFSKSKILSQRLLWLLGLFAIPVFLVAALGILGVRLNLTPSVPIGLYRITADPDAHFAEICPPDPWGRLSVLRGYRNLSGHACPDGGQALIKPVVAKANDLVDLSPAGITVNGRLFPNTAPASHDTKGRPLQAWAFGQVRVAPETVWVVSSYNARSFDSRYFGPVPVSAIRSHLAPLWTFQ